MSNFSFLWEEALIDFDTQLDPYHSLYRAIRAFCRLDGERELVLTSAQRNLALRLEFSLRPYYDEKPDIGLQSSLQILTGQRFVTELQKTCLEFGVVPPKFGRKFVPA